MKQATCVTIQFCGGTSRFVARFRFVLPYLPPGQFALSAAIAQGTQHEHVHHHWFDDAVIFTVDASHVVHGLVGLPMLDISLSPSSSSKTDVAG